MSKKHSKNSDVQVTDVSTGDVSTVEVNGVKRGKNSANYNDVDGTFKRSVDGIGFELAKAYNIQDVADGIVNNSGNTVSCYDVWLLLPEGIRHATLRGFHEDLSNASANMTDAKGFTNVQRVAERTAMRDSFYDGTQRTRAALTDEQKAERAAKKVKDKKINDAVIAMVPRAKNGDEIAMATLTALGIDY